MHKNQMFVHTQLAVTVERQSSLHKEKRHLKFRCLRQLTPANKKHCKINVLIYMKVYKNCAADKFFIVRHRSITTFSIISIYLKKHSVF